jgi:DNA repair protein RadC
VEHGPVPCAGGACAAERLVPYASVVREHLDPRKLRAIHQRAEQIGPLDRPAAMYRFMEPEAETKDREHVWVVFLDIYAMFVGRELLAIGMRDRVSFELGDALSAAFDNRAKYVVLVHNHPSGYALPSYADQNLTASLAKACAETGLLLVDHLIVAPAGDEYFSFRENRLCHR